MAGKYAFRVTAPNTSGKLRSGRPHGLRTVTFRANAPYTPAYLSAAGRNAEALTAIEEAVGILRRRLAEATPERFEPDLASSLNNLSNWLSAAGRNTEALTAIEETR